MELTFALPQYCSGCSVPFWPFWASMLFGLLLGWAWKPKWVSELLTGIKNIIRRQFAEAQDTDAVRLRRSNSNLRARASARTQLVAPSQQSDECQSKQLVVHPRFGSASSGPVNKAEDMKAPSEIVAKVEPSLSLLAQSAISEEDVRDLQRRLLYQDGGLHWDLMMEKAASGISYQAWRRDPEGGPTEYRSRTVFEDASAEIVKDFYWDDEFRAVWDDMLIYAKPLEVCTQTGAEIAHWIRKFPFFCSDREYLIGRRIYKYRDTYFCITKGVPYTAVPRRNKPRRVDVYYSSWCIRAVESKKSGQLTACEVTFFHSEDMGIPKEIAKFGVKQGMWGCVKKMEPGLRKYQMFRKSQRAVSHSACMAQLVTDVPVTFFKDSDIQTEDEARTHLDSGKAQLDQPVNAWKWLVVGGAVVLACSLDRGILGKAVVFGVARRLGKLTRRM